jgi:hypothetical protein
MASWIVIVLWFFITVLIYYIKQSGRPYHSEKHRQNLKYISLLFLFWGAAFVVKGVLTLLSLMYAFEDAEKQDMNMTRMILIILNSLLTDITPCISVLEVKFIELFKKTKRSGINLTDWNEEDEDEDKKLITVNLLESDAEIYGGPAFNNISVGKPLSAV